MKYVDSGFSNEVLDSNFIKKDAVANARRREMVIKQNAEEQMLSEYSGNAARNNDNPGATEEE